MNKDKLIEELKKEVEKLKKEKETLEKENNELDKKVKDLEVQLSFFKNPHTPSSKQIFKTRTPQASKKLGASLGHDGKIQLVTKKDIATKDILAPMCQKT